VQFVQIVRISREKVTAGLVSFQKHLKDSKVIMISGLKVKLVKLRRRIHGSSDDSIWWKICAFISYAFQSIRKKPGRKYVQKGYISPDISFESMKLANKITLGSCLIGESQRQIPSRRLRIAIYDHVFHVPGGGQRYAAEIAKALQDKNDVTYIANQDMDIQKYKDWYNIDLSNCKLKIIKIPFFERIGEPIISESAVIFESKNPFDIISAESLGYDIFINANMLTKVKPQSILSIFICHFPDKKRGRFFHVDDYTYLVTNGLYGSSWVEKRWGIESTHLLYPPVNMYNPESNARNKKNIILSVARFEISGSKKQIEMAKAFGNMVTKNKTLMEDWTFVLAGGTFPGNPYFDKVKRTVDSLSCNIELRPDVTYEELQTLYREAAIFWHACGLKEKDPHRVEHFGMTTVEAMQNFCVPVVIDGGGQREIVEHNIGGFRFKTAKQLQDLTKTLISNVELRLTMAENAYERSHNFNMNVFKTKLEEIISEIETELKGRLMDIKKVI
jgi:glycosyltransferase involved in cell wall biosynthesis